MSDKKIKVSTYCWNCGEENPDELYFKCSPYNKNMGVSTCPACGARCYILWEDLEELNDRQYNRGIPRL